MEKSDIVAQRLHHQLVSHSSLATPYEVVKWMGAIQAQDYRSSLWAIGLRMSASVETNEGLIEMAVADRLIVRTWPMRGTLHFVASEDVRWMLDLLNPRVIQGSLGRYRQLELDETVFSKSRKILEAGLEGDNQLTRKELFGLLEQQGIATHGQRGIHILGHWAMKGLLCHGPKKGSQHTFVLLDDWIPVPARIEEEEALSKLTERYFQSHGPSTDYDFANWAGLKLTDARRGIKLQTRLEKVVFEEQDYWFFSWSEESSSLPNVWLLPAFDEMLSGYKSRAAILDFEQHKDVILKNGIVRPIIILSDQVVGTWKRIIGQSHVSVEFSFFQQISKQKEALVLEQAESFGGFLNKKVVVN